MWTRHPDLAGTPHGDFDGDEVVSLCLSHPTGAAFLGDAAASVLRDLPGLAGVILITASEQHSHCWSHHARCDLGDGIVFAATTPLACPRCRVREPAAVVTQICAAWQNAAMVHAPGCRLVAWNWSWSFWYADPQAEVIAALFGLSETASAVAAWRAFGEAFQHHPYHLRMLYFSPVNDAPAHPLSFAYRGEPLGASWVRHAMGDRLEDCCGPFAATIRAKIAAMRREPESRG